MAISRAEYQQLIKLSADELRLMQDKERIAAERARDRAARVFSIGDIMVGRGGDIESHLAEGARAFREGEEAEGEKQKRNWYARAFVEYRDARIAAESAESEGASLGQTAESAKDAAASAGGAVIETGKKVAQSAASGLENVLIAAVIGYFVTEALKGGRRGY